MTEENLNGNQLVPTGMGLDTGPDIEAMSPESAAQEYNALMRDPNFSGSGYEDNITHRKRVERSQKLFSRGFSEKLAKEKETQEREAEKMLMKENERIQTRDESNALEKAKEINLKFFGNKKVFDQVVKRAVEVVSQFSDNEKEFLKECMPNSDLAWGDSPLIISWLANLRFEPDLIRKVKENGLKHYIRLYSLLRRQK